MDTECCTGLSNMQEQGLLLLRDLLAVLACLPGDTYSVLLLIWAVAVRASTLAEKSHEKSLGRRRVAAASSVQRARVLPCRNTAHCIPGDDEVYHRAVGCISGHPSRAERARPRLRRPHVRRSTLSGTERKIKFCLRDEKLRLLGRDEPPPGYSAELKCCAGGFLCLALGLGSAEVVQSAHRPSEATGHKNVLQAASALKTCRRLMSRRTETVLCTKDLPLRGASLIGILAVSAGSWLGVASP